jgi:hypothetical protein
VQLAQLDCQGSGATTLSWEPSDPFFTLADYLDSAGRDKARKRAAKSYETSFARGDRAGRGQGAHLQGLSLPAANGDWCQGNDTEQG